MIGELDTMNQSTGNLVQRGTSIFVMQQDSYMLSQNSWQLIYPYTSKSLLRRSSLVERIYVSWMTWQLDILLIIEEFVFLVLELRIQFYILCFRWLWSLFSSFLRLTYCSFRHSSGCFDLFSQACAAQICQWRCFSRILVYWFRRGVCGW